MSISINPNILTAIPATESSGITQKDVVAADSLKSTRVEKAIKDFEGLFMSMIIKELRQSSSGEGLFAGDASDSYGGMFDMMMGNQLAEGKGLGLKSLFHSSAAMSQVENQLKSNSVLVSHEKAIEGYRNAQLPFGSAANTGA